MADGTCGVSSRDRALASRSDEACVDEDARQRIEANQAEARRRKDAEAEERARTYYANGVACIAPPTVSSCTPPRTPTPTPPAAPDPAEKKRIDEIVKPKLVFALPGPIEKEVQRLRALRPAANDTALAKAIAARQKELVEQWCTHMRSVGLGPPSATFNPYTATDEELERALFWTTVAGVVPIEAAQHDGGVQFREDIVEAAGLRLPGLGEEILASYAGDPGTQRVLLERELRRLGDRRECRADETNEQLLARRAELLRAKDLKERERQDGEPSIGLDGKQGTARELVEYEIEQRIAAMNPGTTMGGLLAANAAMHGGSTEEIRAAGRAGNAVEGLGGALAAVDPRTVGKRAAEEEVRGRRRIAAGPGLGRRTRVAMSTSPASDVRSRTPIGLDDKHVLNGEVKLTPGGAARAVGFHHQAPGTESKAHLVAGTMTKPDKNGVYRASVEVKDPTTGTWVRKRPESTFFPQSWSRSDVRTAILEAYANRTDLGNGDWEGSANGVRIRGHTDPNGHITAYPIMEEGQ